jgi:hypothetical protein
MNLTKIYEGDLVALQKIPKNQITTEFSKNCIYNMEQKIEHLEHEISIMSNNGDMKYNIGYFLGQKHKIESCISYLNKIK